MDPASARVLILHFGTSTQRLKFYPLGSREDLLVSIREVLGVDADAPLRFRDEDGDIVLLSPRGIPPGTVLHVAVENGVPFEGTRARAPAGPAGPAAAPQACDWKRWDRAQGSLTISGDGLTVATVGGSGWAGYTQPLPTSGQHYFVVEFPKERPCCAAVGLIPASLASLKYHRHLVLEPSLPAMVALKGVGRGPQAAFDTIVGTGGPLSVGVYLDADARRMVLVPHDDPQNPAAAIRIDNVPLPAVFAICSPKHDVTATIRPAEQLPMGGVFSGERAKVDKS